MVTLGDRAGATEENTDSSFERVVSLIARLRDPTSGCPWDCVQDHRSLRTYALEEAHELVEALDKGDDDLILEELGDVLLQVLLHSQIAAERDAFAIDDVCEHLAAKLVRRHPHVFADASRDLREVCARWDRIKASEGKPRLGHPALIEARKLLDRLPAEFAIDRVEPDGEEERAGLRLLGIMRELREDDVDPEIAVRRGIAAIRRHREDEDAT